MKKNTIFLLLLLLLLLSVSCSQSKKENSADLAVFNEIATGNEWAVISDPYAAFYSEPSKTSPVQSHGRKADVHEIQGKKIVVVEQSNEIWYEFEKGWLKSDSVCVYSNKIQAENASQKMMK